MTEQERLYAELEALKIDLAAMERNLKSKSEAIHILTVNATKYKSERDQFKAMAEKVQSRYQSLRRTLNEDSSTMKNSKDNLAQFSTKQLISLVHESREANKSLQMQLIDLSSKYTEVCGDVLVLRGNMQRLDIGSSSNSTDCNKLLDVDERQTFVYELEEYKSRVEELRRELDRYSDEKMELAGERDVYRNKCDRLNNELNYILNGDERKIVDIDALINENKLLSNRLQAMEEEKTLLNSTLVKYKRLLSRRTPKPSSSSLDQSNRSSFDSSDHHKDPSHDNSYEAADVEVDPRQNGCTEHTDGSSSLINS